MKHRQFLTFLISVSMISGYSQKTVVDIVIHNATIYTVDEAFSIKQAMAINDGRLVATGSDREILVSFSSDQTIDLAGKFVYPGFNDAHCHFLGYGTNKIKRADLVGTKSFIEVVDRLKEHSASYPSEWIEGRGWDQNDWENKSFPTNDLLNEAFPDKPVYLIRIDGHAAIANAKALEMAGITAETKISGGEVLLVNGKPGGVLIDNAMGLVEGVIPGADTDFIIAALKKAETDCFAVGLTSVSDAGLSKNEVDIIHDLHQQGELEMRINAMLTPNEENLNHFVEKGPWQTDRLNVSSIKLYADGALGSRGARMIEPYSDDPGNLGLFMYDEDYYINLCQLAYNNNFQVCTHAIGDGGNRFTLNLYKRFVRPNDNRRWRIEHAQIIHPDDFAIFGEYGIIPSVQPTHATSDMYWAEDRVGSDRIKGAYAYRQLLNENGWIPLGTDFPIESINPLYTFYAAVARKDLKGYPEEGYQSENALSREEALRGMTIWAARAAIEESKKGSLEAGKVADFVILDKDLMTLDIDNIPELKVEATFVAGERVYPTED